MISSRYWYGWWSIACLFGLIPVLKLILRIICEAARVILPIRACRQCVVDIPCFQGAGFGFGHIALDHSNGHDIALANGVVAGSPVSTAAAVVHASAVFIHINVPWAVIRCYCSSLHNLPKHNPRSSTLFLYHNSLQSSHSAGASTVNVAGD